MIHIQNLSFGFPQKELFTHVSCDLGPDRHCALIGSNGSGKTTLVQLLLHPEDYLYEGKVTVPDRIAYVSQFAQREKDLSCTVYDYLAADFLRLEEHTAQLCAQMETAEDLDSLLEAYQAALDEGDRVELEQYDANIRRQLHLSGLTEKTDLALSVLSGGEYKIIQIIRAMLRRPALLIMDEPDVFLDFENLTGLRHLINQYNGTLLTVTHSRYLLTHCFDQIWHLEQGDLQQYEGSYAAYQHQRLQAKLDKALSAQKDEAEIQRITALVERLRKEATEVIEPQKGRTLKGKVSYLQRLERQKVKAPFVELPSPRIAFSAPEEAAEGPLLTVEGFSLAFDRELLGDVSFAVNPGEKVALVGPNGTGKTSLLRAIRENRHSAIRFAPGIRVGYFSQLHQEVLDEGSTLYDVFSALPTREAVETHLAAYCFAPDGLNRTVSQLSGGEKNLLQLARLALEPWDLLLLDEPSSHLDTFAQEALQTALEQYPGAVLMVSHDFFHIALTANTILYVEDGTVRPMRPRAFRKRIYKNHFDQEYLEQQQQRTDLERRVQRLLECGDLAQAQTLCDQLGQLVDKMEASIS